MGLGMGAARGSFPGHFRGGFNFRSMLSPGFAQQMGRSFHGRGR
jgi:hypothetical protein